MEKTVVHSRIKENKSLKEKLNLIRVNIKPIVTILLATFLISVIYAINARNIYLSTTTLKISKPSGSILKSPLLPEFQDFGSDRFILNEIEILKSYLIRERVGNALVDSFHHHPNNNFFLILNHDRDSVKDGQKSLGVSQIAKLLEKQVTIEQKRGLDIADISVESPSPYEAALIANCYAEQYKSLSLEINRNQLTNVKTFLGEQRVEKQKELRDSEDLLRGYQERGGIISLDVQAKSLIEQLSSFDAKKNAAKIDLSASNRVLQQLNSELLQQNPKLADYLKNFANEGYIKTLQEQLGRLEVNKDLAMSNADKTVDRSKTIKEYDNKITEIRKKLNEKIEQYKSAVFASSPEEIKELSKKIIEEKVKNNAYAITYTELEKIVGTYETKFNMLPKTSIELARLSRQREALEKLYLLLEEKYQEALINEQSQPGNVIIIDKGRISNTPEKPNRFFIILSGIIFGSVISILFVFIKNYFDNTVKTPEDLTSRNINVLSWIPRMESVGNNKEYEFIVAKKPDSIPSEAFKVLRTRIQYTKLDAKELKTILITSSAPQEGKTTVCVNVAGTFAQSNKKTIILDCDLRKPRIHSVFNEKRYPGIVDYLFGEATLEEITRKTELPNLFFIPAGTIPPNPAEMLESTAMHAFFDDMKSKYDIVLLDSPPMIAVTDSEILSNYADVTILVVSADTTEIELLEKSVSFLKNKNNSFIGAVLNNFEYKSGYGSYYKYYYYYSHENANNGRKRTIE